MLVVLHDCAHLGLSALAAAYGGPQPTYETSSSDVVIGPRVGELFYPPELSTPERLRNRKAPDRAIG